MQLSLCLCPADWNQNNEAQQIGYKFTNQTVDFDSQLETQNGALIEAGLDYTIQNFNRTSVKVYARGGAEVWGGDRGTTWRGSGGSPSSSDLRRSLTTRAPRAEAVLPSPTVAPTGRCCRRRSHRSASPRVMVRTHQGQPLISKNVRDAARSVP